MVSTVSIALLLKDLFKSLVGCVYIGLIKVVLVITYAVGAQNFN